MKNCERCGTEFNPYRPAQRFCSKRCGDIINIARAKQRRWDENHKDVICPICKTNFKTIWSKQIYCSSKCGKRASYERLRDEQLEIARVRYATDPTFRLRSKLNGRKPEVREKQKLKAREFRRLHPDEARKKDKENRLKNRELIKSYNETYRENNKEKIFETYRRYKMKDIERYRAKAKIVDKRCRENKKRRINEIRKREGLPLIGELNYNEAKMRKLLTQLIDSTDYYDNKYWHCVDGRLINGCSRTGGLQLDRYYPTLKLAFEYDGPQHFMFRAPFHQSQADLEMTKMRDRKKNEMCDDAGITMVRFNCFDRELTEEKVLKRICDAEVLLPIIGSVNENV